MFIKRLKLVNFIGIKSGTGKDEIEINFPKNGKIINMFMGANGSGKSTVMSMLTPYKESFDESRKTLILPGKEGIKEIDIEHNGHEYKIKHVYGKTTSSFFSEDGIELNENGGVRTCEELIVSKLKAEKDYFKIGKLGSNTDTFIQFTTTQRKIYISSFVEAVKKYIDAFEIVNKKAKLNETQIKQISSDLKKLDDIATLVDKIRQNNELIQQYDSVISKSTSDIAKLDVEINNIAKTMAAINYLDLKSLLKVKEESLRKNYKINEKFDQLYKDVDLQKCQNKIVELKNLLNDLKNQKSIADSNNSTLTTNIVNIDNDITKAKNQLIGKNAIDLNQLMKNIDETTATKDKLETEIKSNMLAVYMKKNEAKTPSYLDSFKTFMLTMLSYYSVLNDNSIDPAYKNVELFFKPDFSSVFGSYTANIKTSLSNNREALDTANNDYSTKTANLDKLDILAKRPNECKIDSCPFIADALKYVNLPEEIADIESKISGIKNTIQLNEEQAEKLSDIKIAYSEIVKSFKALLPRENIIYAYFVKKYGKISDVMKTPMNDVQHNYELVVQEAETYLDKINQHNECVNTLRVQNLQYNSAVESENNRLYFENEITSLENRRIDIIKDQSSELTTINNLTNQIQDNTTLLQDYEDYKISLTETDALEAEVADFKNSLDVYETASKEKTSKQTERDTINQTLTQAINDRKIASDEITNLKAAEINVKSLMDNMKKLESTFNTIDSVKQALSPKSGIPLIFIQSYLDGTETIANELLNIAYDGKFAIKFIPTATDFFIQVKCGENIIDDIKAASQGEISMTTISISLALIERSLGEYNIMYLDEIDGPLDIDNREYFINILNKQIARLGLEQVFVISHNNAYENCSMNLILMPGNRDFKSNELFMENKEIIYEAE